MDRETALTARRFARLLRKQLNLEQLILFGSRARGDHLAHSDFDFVVVSKDFKGVPYVLRGGRVLKWWDSRHDMEPLCYTPGEWKRLKGKRGILMNALRDGVRLT
jgi:hypothetical protein